MCFQWSPEYQITLIWNALQAIKGQIHSCHIQTHTHSITGVLHAHFHNIIQVVRKRVDHAIPWHSYLLRIIKPHPLPRARQCPCVDIQRPAILLTSINDFPSVIMWLRTCSPSPPCSPTPTSTSSHHVHRSSSIYPPPTHTRTHTPVTYTHNQFTVKTVEL